MFADERANFILIDHSIAAEGGHYLEYARHVLGAAEHLGYRPVLVTNRAFPAAVELPYEVHRLYERDIWGRSLARFREQLRPRLEESRGLHGSRLAARLLSVIRAGATFLGDVVKHEIQVRAFARDTRQVLTRLRPAQADVVFIPTLSEADLMGLARCFRYSTSEAPAWHLLFRREIYLGREFSYAMDRDFIRGIRRDLLRRALRHMFARFPRHRVHVYTDTDRLTDQYDRLGAAKFSTLPIPINPRLGRRSGIQRKVPRLVTYLGDARSEKGYHLLPSVVDALLPELEAGTIRFAVQSNIAFSDPPLDQRVVEARDRLRRLAPRFVTLQEDPLDSSAYAEFLLASGVVLLPYEPERYYARSSGVLVEALSAAIPVVVPASSWMSDFIQPETTRYHSALLAEGDFRNIELEQEWRTQHGEAIEERGDELIFASGVSAVRSYLRPRPTDRHFLVQVVLPPNLPRGTYLHVAARFVGGSGRTFSTDQRLLAATLEQTTSALFAVPPQTERVELSLSGLFGTDPIVLARPRLYAQGTGNRISLEALGRTYVLPTEIPSALRELLSAFDIYAERATEFSARSHLSESAALVVSRLTTRPVDATHRVVDVIRTSAATLTPRDRS